MTAVITVVSTERGSNWECTVQVSEGNGQTRHSVSVPQEAFRELTMGKTTTPEELVRKSFEFLLERESKESILRQFELSTITRYFPEYPAEIRKRL